MSREPLASAVTSAFSPLAQWWGAVLTATYLLQATVSLALDSKFEPGTFPRIFCRRGDLWLFFWTPQSFYMAAGLHAAAMQAGDQRDLCGLSGTWVSPLIEVSG